MGARLGQFASALWLALEAFGQVLQLVQHFGKGWELITLQCFVKYFLTSSRVIHTVDVFVRVSVEVVVLQQQVFAGQPADVSVDMAADAESVAEVACFKPFLHFQQHVFVTLNHSALQNDTLAFMGESKGVADCKGVLAQSAFVDGLVVVPGVPVVRVLARSNLAP